MDIDEYRDRVIELLEDGEKETLQQAAECILYASDARVECGEFFDDCLGVDE